MSLSDHAAGNGQLPGQRRLPASQSIPGPISLAAPAGETLPGALPHSNIVPIPVGGGASSAPSANATRHRGSSASSSLAGANGAANSTAPAPGASAQAAYGSHPSIHKLSSAAAGGSGSSASGASGGLQLMSKIPPILPHERVFPIQIGSELFKLSGASLSSDAPSYFSQYFKCQLKRAEENGEDPAAAIRTLYIDRDPVTFRDISLHLQGYHVEPRDGTHFVRLFADAQFYSLPKLISQLYEASIFMSIGHREFQIPRDLFQDPGNSPNFFSLGFAIFFSSPDDLFPGLDREGLIRPPSILPPSVPGRSADTFAEILHLLRGYPVHIRDDAHRQTLLRDVRYFNFKGLEQKLIPHALSFNQTRLRHEIVLRLEDLLKSGISVVSDLSTATARSPPMPVTAQVPGSAGASSQTTPTASAPAAPPSSASDPLAGWVNYMRPFVDDRPAELVVEIGGENTKLHFFPPAAAAPGSTVPLQHHDSTTPPSAVSSSSISPMSSTVTPPLLPLPHASPATGIRAEFFRDAKTRVTRLFEVIATKLNLPPTTQPLGLLMARGGASSQPPTPGNTPLSESDLVRVVLEPETAIELDGRPFVLEDEWDATPGSSDTPGRKRKRANFDGATYAGAGPLPPHVPTEWTIKTGQWRLRIQGARNGRSAVECVLVGVKLEAMSSERTRNRQRGFLS